jgi:hypothetical protein
MLLSAVNGFALVSPSTIDNRLEYARSLNSIATVMMGWYGSLIIEDNNKSNNKQPFNTIQIDPKWDDYRSKYPNNITQVVITKTDLKKLSSNYQFIVSSKINYKKNNKLFTQSLSETFTLDLSQKIPRIKHITLDENKRINLLDLSVYNQKHYKLREFVYAWLSYLDGAKGLSGTMYADNWINTALYSLEMGTDKLQGKVAEVLAARSKILTVGGHLLHSIKVKKNDSDNNQFSIDLVIQWKGVNEHEKSVIARIHQILTIQINKDGDWKVLSIKEKHLLPLIAPWMGLLC